MSPRNKLQVRDWWRNPYQCISKHSSWEIQSVDLSPIYPLSSTLLCSCTQNGTTTITIDVTEMEIKSRKNKEPKAKKIVGEVHTQESIAPANPSNEGYFSNKLIGCSDKMIRVTNKS